MKKQLKIVLKKDIPGLGSFGEIKEVSAGYARNYLIPLGFALYLKDGRSKEILRQAEERKKLLEKEVNKLKELAEKINGSVLEIKAKATKEGKLYGGIGPQDVLKYLWQKNKIKLDKDQIKMEPLKEIGETEAMINFGHQIQAFLKIKVVIESK